ncbi:MAG: deoxyribodipyrimidine photo-lyase [Burkholderiaceae bacterium]
MQTSLDSALVWFRRDLRVRDNAALYHALRAARRVWCVFLFDRDILDPLPRVDRRVEFIHASLLDLDRQLRELGLQHGVAGVRLLVRHGRAPDEIVALARTLGAGAVFANHDDDPAALRRDSATRGALAHAGIAMHTSKDHVVFERSEVLTLGATPYTVFTPYKNAWLRKLDTFFVTPYPVAVHARNLAAAPDGVGTDIPGLAALGFEPGNLGALQIAPGSAGAETLLAEFLTRIDAYDATRDFPALDGPSRLSVHLRFGTVSIRELAAAALERIEQQPAGARSGASVWLSELIWRDFYHQILHHHPHVVGASFKPEYDRIRWEQGPHAQGAFDAWCDGRTGYPLVDAAMTQINQTGYMHNRLRMVVASFLTKDLGLDWRWGEAYFATQLNDYDLAANNGGWQWAASSGCDAQPWFRIFNPVAQSRKFDPQGAFIRSYLPRLAALPDAALHAPWTARPADLVAAGVTLGHDYPHPIVQHDEARAKTLARYAVVRKAGAPGATPS